MASSLNIATQIAASLLSSDQLSDQSVSSLTPSAPTWKPIQPSGNLRCRIQRPGAADVGPLSPTLSPIKIRSDLTCTALSSAAASFADVAEESETVLMEPSRSCKPKGVPVFVMLPLDTVRANGSLSRKKAMNASLMALKAAGVEGIMVDVWWGLVERERPGEYNWGGYNELLDICRRIGLKVQAVMSFHHCDGNVGDSCTIPLPRWAIEEMEKDHDIMYTDQNGRRNYEYVSLGCDTLPVLKGRTPIQCYADFMCAFRDQFQSFLGSTIVEIQVGMGPAGELRYPSYPELNGTWKFPGIGAFQCYDKYMISSLKAAAEEAGKPEWGRGGPTDAGSYNNWPEDTPFFRRDGGWNGPYGKFFLTWYSEMLLSHGDRILSSATSVFSDVKISVKVAVIHWHYGTRSHAPELTAGYYNTRFRDGYLPIARMLARHGAVFNFTCVEMRDGEQPRDAMCRPEGLVKQVGIATREAGVGLAGENALPRYDSTALDQIVRTAVSGEDEWMCAFTYLRMTPELFHPENWKRFVWFVKRMGMLKYDTKHDETVKWCNATDESTSVLRKAESEYKGHRSLLMRTRQLLTTMSRQDVMDRMIMMIGFLIFMSAVLYVVTKRVGLLKLQRKITAAINSGSLVKEDLGAKIQKSGAEGGGGGGRRRRGGEGGDGRGEEREERVDWLIRGRII